MTPKEAKNKMLQRYLTEFTGQFSIAVTGQKFIPPKIPAEWVRISVIFNDGNQISLGREGNRRFKLSGFFVVQVFTPVNTGTNRNDEIAGNSLIHMNGISIEPMLWLFDGKINTVGDKGDYYQQNVVVEFNFEDIR